MSNMARARENRRAQDFFFFLTLEVTSPSITRPESLLTCFASLSFPGSSDVAQLLGAENQQDDDQNDQPVPNAK
jgi:hypothetical protein